MKTLIPVGLLAASGVVWAQDSRKAHMHFWSYARVLVAAALILGVAGCATTSILVGTPRAPISPNEVKIYLDPPARYEQVAILDANNKYSFAFTDQQRMDVVIERLKAEAARFGANGILFQGAGDRYTGSIGASTVSWTRRGVFGLASAMPLYIKEARGIGMYVEPETASTGASSAMAVANDGRIATQSASTQMSAPLVPTSSTPSVTSKRVVGATFGENADGLVVLSVDKKGVAARAGLKAGDVVTHIDGRRTNVIYWEYAVDRLTNSGDTVTVRLLWKGDRTLSFVE